MNLPSLNNLFESLSVETKKNKNDNIDELNFI